MSGYSKLLIKSWLEKPLSRKAVLRTALTSFFAASSLGNSFGAATPVLTPIIGRPTNSSATISLISSEKISAYIEYGISKSTFTKKTTAFTFEANEPKEFDLTNLAANKKIYYRIRYKTPSASIFSIGTQGSFSTQKSKGSTFSFTVQGDTHPERAGKMFNADLYKVTMVNIATQQPDFHILLGDDFSIDPLIDKGQANQENVEKIYKTHREWLSISATSVPLFLVNGNHEQAAAYLLDGTATNPAVLAGNARLKYFPLPAPSSFYTGDSYLVPNVGLPRDYYSWVWGDALFITLDPYWHSSLPVDNLAGVSATDDQGKNGKNGDNGKTKNLWQIGIGDDQYAWLKKTLEESTAKYKFVFAHHVMGTGRGAIEVSSNYEWGGKDPSGTTTFAKERPNWELPIHDLMVKNKVSIFFQGHDHIFCTQERDGLIYQSMPNPADDTFSMFNETAYKSGTKAANSGHVKVTVSSTQAKVEYFLAARNQDTSRKNRTIAHTYSVKPGA
jgi:Calcineurin-like phosphoesterase